MTPATAIPFPFRPITCLPPLPTNNTACNARCAATGDPLIILETEAPECCNDYTFNDELPPTSINDFLSSLVNNCGGTGGIPSIVFDEGNVFPTINGTQSASPHVHLQALSHLDEQCDNLQAGSYVLHWGFECRPNPKGAA